MSISREEAQQALGSVEDARGRMFRATFYGRAAPGLIIWGVVWLICDLVTQFAPLWASLAWPIGVTAGSVACIVLGVRSRVRGKSDLRPLATSIAVFAFVYLLIMVAWPLDARQVHSIFGLIFGLGYTIMGLWFGGRLLVLGLGLAALTLFGQYGLPNWYFLYMGVVVGGALMLGGLWLRKV